MAKLTFLALALAALVAFATAHTTIVTTTIQDEYPFSEQRQCSQRLQGQRLNQCRMFLQQQDQIPYNWGRQQQQQQHPQQQQQMLQQCCQQLQNVEEQCQCEAVKQVFREAQQEQQQQQGPRFIPFFGSQQTQRLKQKAEMLPNVCNLQSRQCRIGTITTTLTKAINQQLPWPFPTFQQCSQTDLQRPVNKCHRYVSQQMRSPRAPLQYRPQQQSQELQQCCDELHYMKDGCECEAIREVAKSVIRQQQQGGQFGGQQTEMVRRVVRDLPNQCMLYDIQQCNV